MADQSDVCIILVSLGFHPEIDRKFCRSSGAALQSDAAKPPILLLAVYSQQVFKILEDSVVVAMVVTDPDLALEEHADVWDTIVRYTLAGRFCDAPTFSLPPFFARAGLPWKAGSWVGPILDLNHLAVNIGLDHLALAPAAHSPVVGPSPADRLPPRYNFFSHFLANVNAQEAWYIPADPIPERRFFEEIDGY
ncbi:hypothetical protein B0T26DRAFT_753696 [Lasiosphaeria miniovina]|uniref:Uncharacterized protein n=1 Tax=Lasiosphaeria miniovina TaxID=1954250 RepID=A0AA40AD64_9PEZI|nr:uncharacterized protein B0T26DRAFT_753696 [Lasiosphaeria miniovina]KAK0713604.1 hypothetical protein B0T26DRAFT_753696 [Lasiosphaeria miniovina]